MTRRFGLFRKLTMEMERWTFTARSEAEAYRVSHQHPSIPWVVVELWEAADDEA